MYDNKAFWEVTYVNEKMRATIDNILTNELWTSPSLENELSVDVWLVCHDEKMSSRIGHNQVAPQCELRGDDLICP